MCLTDKAKIVYSPAEVFLAFGKPGTLDCHFHSNPPLTKIRWEKDGFLFDTYNVPGVYHKLNGSLYFDKVSSETMSNSIEHKFYRKFIIFNHCKKMFYAYFKNQNQYDYYDYYISCES